MALALVFVVSTANALEIDLEKSHFSWKGSKITGSEHYGKLKLKSAKLVNKDQNYKGSEFVVDINSLTVTDLEGDSATKFLKHMKSADFFEVEKYPTAKLVVDKIENGKLHGQLTIKDKTNAVEMPFTKENSKYKGKITFDRTKYNMVYGSKNFFKNLGDRVINDEVHLSASIYIK